jgi:hypothetical protein
VRFLFSFNSAFSSFRVSPPNSAIYACRNPAGWAGGALWTIVLFMAIWYLLSAWNEQRRTPA